MRGIFGLFALVALLGGLLAVPVVAQEEEETPVAAEDEFAPPEGVSFEPLAFRQLDELPAAPAEFGFARFRLQPGAVFPIEPTPGYALVYVEEGALTFTVDMPVTVTRPAAGEDEEIAGGEAYTLEQGEIALFPPFAAGELRNAGEEEAVILGAFLGPVEGEEAVDEAMANEGDEDEAEAGEEPEDEADEEANAA